MAEGTLTPRQQEVLDLHDKGKRNVEIAEMLGVEAGTVSNALTTALRKMGREKDIGGGNGPRQTSGSTVADDPEAEFLAKFEGHLRREQELTEASVGFPESLEDWIAANQEALQKQYDSDRERIVGQAEQAQARVEKWTAMAEKLGVEVPDISEPEPEAGAEGDQPDAETTEPEPETEAATTA